MDELENNLGESPELSTTDAAPEQEPVETEQPEGDQADGEGDEPELEEVDLEGEKLAVPKTAAEKLKAAMLRQADYTRKTQELAAQREQFQATQQAREAQIEAEKANIQSVARVTAIDERLQQFANVDWQALNQSDPVTAQAQWFQYQQLRDTRGQLVQQIQQHEAQRALKEQQSLQQAQEVLGREIKGWSPEYAKELRQIAKELGADDAELASIKAPWIVRALHAQKVLRDMTAKAAATPKPPPATPVKTVTGTSAKATFDPNKASIEEYMAHERARLAKARRR